MLCTLFADEGHGSGISSRQADCHYTKTSNVEVDTMTECLSRYEVPMPLNLRRMLLASPQ